MADKMLDKVLDKMTEFNSSFGNNNTTDTVPRVNGVDPLYIIAIVFCIVIIITGVVGNIMVLVVFGGGWIKARSCGIYLINMALANLIGTTIIPSELLLEVMNYGVRFLGDLGCKIIAFLSNTSISVSAFSLILITVDRYIVMRRSTRNACSIITMLFLNIVTWILATGIAVIYLIGDRIKLHHSGDISVCRHFAPPKEQIMYTFIVFGIQVVIPLIIMTVLYAMMVNRIKSHSKDALLKRDEKTPEYLKRDRIAVRILMTIVVIFFICQLPVNVFFFLDMFGVHGLEPAVMIRVYTFLHMLQMASNCINPIIYFTLIRYLHKLTAARGGTENEAYVTE